MNRIRQVAIVGGTHGNELTGAYLVKKFERHPELLARSSVKTLTVLGNPKAVAARTRYIDRDLNRCFSKLDLADPSLSSYEDQRAKEINQILGPNGNPQVDLILDLHTTTSNMGLTIIPASQHPFNLRLAAYLSSLYPQVKVCLSLSGHHDSFLRSLSPLGCTIEVGAIAQGILDAALFQQTEALIHAVLDYLEACNQGRNPTVSETVTVYQCIAAIDYPRDAEGELSAMIHPTLQFKDYEALNPGDAMFLSFDGETLYYQGNATTYPVFINEAAYYEKGIALWMTEKREEIVN